MPRTNRLVKNVDIDSWRKFVGLCKFKGIKVSDELKKVLDKHVEKEISKLSKRKK